ncbi:molecular chaperone Tir [Pseudomonas sp. R5(2019)]|uniref:molecular chaperone Tir n=1 Tax=Pseudomonas sp. R5(2019) TaxID=2697566 RepID=UPI001412A4D3|nr:molecular chaperone Tir [Pseudomonas sp. R5(2019)]NBA93928.1 molecular chaperone Tir [Pseudomonas sp. R5(2019)]
MTVSISYRYTDRFSAHLINERLKAHDIPTCMNAVDLESCTINDITTMITRCVMECSHLITVVSDRSAQSWWLPFQIGEATMIDRRITTYNTLRMQLPEYLKRWPAMTCSEDVDFFIECYRDEQRNQRIIDSESLAAIAGNKRNADIFHTALKARIRRGA